MKHRTRIIALLTLTVLLACLVGCGQKDGEDFTFSAAVVGVPAGFDPALAATEGEKIAALHLYENLMRLQPGENGTQVVGALADSCERTDNPDGTETYVFHLRRNAKWSDGKTVRASEIVYAWQHLVAESTGSPNAALLNMVAGYEEARRGNPDALQVYAKSNDTLEVVLQRHCPYFLRVVCTDAATVPRRPDMPNRIGSVTNGPYVLGGYENGVLTLTAADYYYDAKRLGPDTIAIRYCDTAEQAAALMEAGTVDFVCGVADEAVAEQGEWLRDPYPETAVLIVNQMNQQLENEELRQALSLAIDRTELASLAGAALHTPAEGLVPAGIAASEGGAFRTPEGIHIDISDYEGSCQTARELLNQSGVASLTDVTICCAGDEVSQAVAGAICRQWQEKLGLTVQAQSMEPEEYTEALTGGAFQMAIVTCTSDRNDAEEYLKMWQSGHSRNYAQFHSTAYDMLLRVAESASSVEARDACLSDAERLLVEQGNAVPLYCTNRVYWLRGGLTGLISDGLGVFRFDGVRRTAG